MPGHLPYNSADFLRPIREDANRDEYILVEFHRVLRNTNMSLLLNLIHCAKKDPTILEIFPGIADFVKLDIDSFYTATVMYNYPWELLKMLCRDRLDTRTCMDFAERFREPYNFEQIHACQLEGALRQLLNTKFVKKLYIVADSFSTEMEQYIVSMFGDKGIGSVIIPLKGYWIDAVLTYPEITTVFIGNSNELVHLGMMDQNAIKNKLFIVLDGYNNFECHDVGGKPVVQYCNIELFEKWHKERICTVGFAYPYFIPRMPVIESRNERPKERNEPDVS